MNDAEQTNQKYRRAPCQVRRLLASDPSNLALELKGKKEKELPGFSGDLLHQMMPQAARMITQVV